MPLTQTLTFISLTTLLVLATAFLYTPPVHAQTQGEVCNLYTPSVTTPTGYGASYNVFNQSELMISIYCNEDKSVTVTAGNNDPLTYVYNQGYYYANNQWNNFTYTCTDETIANAWCTREATKTLTNTPTTGTTYLVSYTCQWRNNTWNCGCHNSACTTNHWQLQGWTIASGGGGGNTSSTQGPAAACGEVYVANGKTYYYDFENGVFPSKSTDSALKAEYPPVIMSESNGNHFLRITATENDLTWTGGQSSTRVRSQLVVGSAPSRENESYTYSFSVRLGEEGPGKETTIMQLFQYSNDPSSTYGSRTDGHGPSVWLRLDDDGIQVNNFYNYGQDGQKLVVGVPERGRTIHFDIGITWALNPAKARVNVWKDGVLVGSLTGKPTHLSEITGRSANMHIGLYGDGGIGTIDFDNVVVRKGLVSPSGCDN